MPRSIREIDTLLNSGILSTLELRITYGATADMMSTEATAYTITKADVEVHLDEAIRLDGKDEPYSAYKSGTDVFRAKMFDVIQGQNAIDYDLEDQTFVGYGYVDFCPEGRLVDALNASGLSSLEMILDVSHPGTTDKVRIYPCEIVPPMPA